MEVVLICVVAFVASVLTFFSGYGLGTILFPVFSLFFPVELAMAMTAFVHLLNNVFKVGLTIKNANWSIVRKFGLPSIIASFLGAFSLTQLTVLQPLWSYSLYGHELSVQPAKLLLGLLLLYFAMLEWFPALLKVGDGPGILFTGGVLSGFFGGLTGNQGALRSAFLIRAGLSKEAFIATGVFIACLVDVARLIVYSERMEAIESSAEIRLIATASLAAFAGAFLGNKLLKKMTLKSLQVIVTALLITYALLLISGVV
jgi:uncharacterized protein